jgi:hypothetical protein
MEAWNRMFIEVILMSVQKCLSVEGHNFQEQL